MEKMTEREIKNLWGCLQSLIDAGYPQEEIMELADRLMLRE